MFTIGLFEKSIGFLEINKENNISFAYLIKENFKLENLYNQSKLSDTYINETAEMINGVIDKINATVNSSKLLIETNFCFANVIPLDINESPDKINSNILWELSNFYPDSYKNYKINYYKLSSYLHSDNVREVLIIAIKNYLIEAIRKLSKQINIKIGAADVEHFASEKYFRYIRKTLLNDEAILIIGCKRGRFDFSIINRKECLGYDYFLSEDSNFQEKLINQYLKIEEKYRALNINNIYLYGDEVTSVAYKIINDIAKSSRLILSNPFYELGITNDVDTEIVSEGFKFIPLCGNALN